MRFLTTNAGDIAESAIIRIGPPHQLSDGKTIGHRVIFQCGAEPDTAFATEHEVERLTIIPAAPGFCLVFHDGDEVFDGDPIIAWRIGTRYSTPDPVAVSGPAASNAMVRTPGGQIIDAEGTMYDNADAFIASRKAEAA